MSLARSRRVRVTAILLVFACSGCCGAAPNKNGDKPLCDEPATTSVQEFIGWQFLDIGGERRMVVRSAGDDGTSCDEVELPSHQRHALTIDAWAQPSFACAAAACVAAWRTNDSGHAIMMSVRGAVGWSVPVQLGVSPRDPIVVT